VNGGSGFRGVLLELFARGRTWVGSLAILTISAMMPLALAQSNWVEGIRRLVAVTLLGALFGLLAARRPRGRWLWPLVALSGLVLAVLVAGRVWPPLAGAGERAEEAYRRLSWWLQVIWAGGSTDDPLIPLVAAGLILWLASFWLAWASFRLKQALLAAAPAGAILACNTFFGLGGANYLLAFVPLALLLMMQARLWDLEQGFRRQGTLYSEAMRARLLGYTLPAVVLVTVLATFVPFVSAGALSQAIWKRADKPWGEVVRWANWLFPSLGGKGKASSWLADNASAAMPAARALQGEASPGADIVMYVRTSDPPPLDLPEHLAAERLDMGEASGPRRYWRGMTYDQYTGRGWANSNLDIVRSEAGQRFLEPQGPRELVTQDFQIIVPRDELLYAVADPVAVDAISRVRWRGQGDLAFVHASVGRYSVISAAPKVTERELREAGTDYGAEIRERYLQLPPLSKKVRDLTQEITAGAETPYDKLVAIESYLRREYTYDLNVPQPAEGKDVVEYFLFEARRGYCDYYASAMVVLARAAGIPARLASGYATGDYDHEAQRYVVREYNAHSWPEAYFPGYGWIEFEPTVSQARLRRPSGEEPVLPPVRPAQPRRARGLMGTLPWAAAALGVVLVAGGVTFAARRRQAGGDPVFAAYQGLQGSARLLGLVVPESQTPREYGSALARHVLLTARKVGMDNGHHWLEREATTGAIEAIALAYERQRYSPCGGDGAAYRAESAWREVRGRLRSLALRRAPLLLRERVAKAARQNWRRLRAHTTRRQASDVIRDP